MGNGSSPTVFTRAEPEKPSGLLQQLTENPQVATL